MRAAEVVARHVEKLILEGALRPGDRLAAEREIAAELQVSRPSVRDGLKLLQEKGLVVAQPGGGTVVARLGGEITDPLVALLLSGEGVIDNYLEFRTLLEGAAARLAAERANRIDLAMLGACIERIDRAHELGDVAEEAEADLELHVVIYEATHNVVLLHVMRALSTLLRSDVFQNRERLYARPKVRELLREQHRAIHAAIVAGDGAAAAEAAQAHLGFVRQAAQEIQAANEQLEVSLRRLEGGKIGVRPAPATARTGGR
jgi:GntR family transcriptional repressor for pyruvate dehydrogenase complex